MKLWVDDLRPAPEGWVHMLHSDSAIAQLFMWHQYQIPVEEVSLDHDLGEDAYGRMDDTMRIVDWMRVNECWPDVVTIHTQNSIGRENLLRAVNNDAPENVEIFIKTW